MLGIAERFTGRHMQVVIQIISEELGFGIGSSLTRAIAESETKWINRARRKCEKWEKVSVLLPSAWMVF